MTPDYPNDWRVNAYQSGTVAVSNSLWMDDPVWLDVGYRNVPFMDEGSIARGKYQMAEDVAAYLNGGDMPAWMRDLERVSESTLLGAAGECITANGPVYDADPPKLFWKQKEDEASRNRRAALICRLCPDKEKP